MTARSPDVRQLILTGAARLEQAGVAQARHETRWVLERLLDVRGPALYLREDPIEEDLIRQFWQALEQRAQGTPLQYVLGETAFCGLSLEVAPGVFIPRPETECLVAAALEALRPAAHRSLRLLDAGTGSGAIAIVLARQLDACVVVGVELSWEALRVARRNIRRHKLMERIRLVQGDWLKALRGPLDGLVCNPPYIASSELDRLPCDVQREPRESVDGGPDGLQALRELAGAAPRVLAPGGILAMECAETQVEPMRHLIHRSEWAQASRIVQDLAGRPRGLIVRRRPFDFAQGGVPSGVEGRRSLS